MDAQKNLNKLTNAERLVLERRRKYQTQRDVAKARKVPLWVVICWESNEKCVIPAPQAELKHPTPGERCYIARRRQGMTLRNTARAMKISHVRVVNMEREDESPDSLLRFWEHMGYKL